MAVIFKRVWIIHLLLHFRWSKLGSGLQTCHLGKSGILYWMGNKNCGKAKIQLQTCQQKGMPYFDSRWIWYCDSWWKRISGCSIANMYPRVRFVYNLVFGRSLGGMVGLLACLSPVFGRSLKGLWEVFGWSLGGFWGLWEVFEGLWEIFGRPLGGVWEVFTRSLTQDEYGIVTVDEKGSMDVQLPTSEYNF